MQYEEINTTSGIFTIPAIGLAFGNLIRVEMVRDKKVLFAGCKRKHPLEDILIFEVSTMDHYTPEEAMEEALSNIKSKAFSLLNPTHENKHDVNDQ